MIRVLHITPDFGAGGAERMLVHLLQATDRREFAVGALSLFKNRNNDLTATLEAAAIPVTYLDKRLGFDLRMFRQIWRSVIEFRPHVVHTHRSVLRFALPVLIRLPGVAKVHTLHTLADWDGGRGGRAVLHLAYRMGVAPVAIADEVAASVRRVYGIEPRACIPNGIPVELYRRNSGAGAAWRRSVGLSTDTRLVTCVARLSDEKNHALLLHGFAAIAPTLSTAHLLLVGEGPEEDRLKRLALELGIADRVHFLGYRSDVPTILASSDLFALTSRFEGNPLSVMEAMSAGLAVVATAVGGVPELVGHGDCGLMVTPGDTASLAEALTTLLTDDESRRAMGGRASRRAEERFGVEPMSRRYEALYRELLGRR